MAEEGVGERPERPPHRGHHHLRDIEIKWPLGQHRGRPIRHSRRRELVPVPVVTGHAREQCTRGHPA